jgi:hypothetical protein
MMRLFLVTLCVLVPPLTVFPSSPTEDLTQYDRPLTRFQTATPSLPEAWPIINPTPKMLPAKVVPAQPLKFFDGRCYTVEAHGWRDEDGILWKPITITTTAYTWTVEGGGTGSGLTATQLDAKRTYGLATDWRALPKGVTLRIPGYGDATVDDKCGKSRQVWAKEREVLVDLRIPNLSKGGSWRSDDHILHTALRHGVKEDRLVLRRITRGAR